MDTTLIIPFMNAIQDVFRKMAGMSITLQKPYLKSELHATYQVCGIIGFSGEITGSVVVSFSDTAADRLVEAFAGAKLERTTPDFSDAVGELANMIAGSAKQYLGGMASITVPQVVVGKGYTVASMRNTPCLVIPCQSPVGEFAVEVSVKRNTAI